MARQPREPEPASDDPLDAASRRLDRAVALLESKLEAVAKQARQSAGSLFDFDRSKLADELDTSRAREKQLQTVGQETSEALGRAIGELRGALQQAEG